VAPSLNIVASEPAASSRFDVAGPIREKRHQLAHHFQRKCDARCERGSGYDHDDVTGRRHDPRVLFFHRLSLIALKSWSSSCWCELHRRVEGLLPTDNGWEGCGRCAIW